MSTLVDSDIVVHPTNMLGVYSVSLSPARLRAHLDNRQHQENPTGQGIVLSEASVGASSAKMEGSGCFVVRPSCQCYQYTNTYTNCTTYMYLTLYLQLHSHDNIVFPFPPSLSQHTTHQQILWEREDLQESHWGDGGTTMYTNTLTCLIAAELTVTLKNTRPPGYIQSCRLCGFVTYPLLIYPPPRSFLFSQVCPPLQPYSKRKH